MERVDIRRITPELQRVSPQVRGQLAGSEPSLISPHEACDCSELRACQTRDGGGRWFSTSETNYLFTLD